jgi:hypothetical protein
MLNLLYTEDQLHYIKIYEEMIVALYISNPGYHDTMGRFAFEAYKNKIHLSRTTIERILSMDYLGHSEEEFQEYTQKYIAPLAR